MPTLLVLVLVGIAASALAMAGKVLADRWTDAGAAPAAPPDDYPAPVAGEPGPDGHLVEMLESLNITDENELVCLYNFLQTPYPLDDAADDADAVFCNSTWDGIACWPTTVAGSTSVLPCFAELNGVKYDTTRKLKLAPFTLYSTKSMLIFNAGAVCAAAKQPGGHEYFKAAKAAYGVGVGVGLATACVHRVPFNMPAGHAKKNIHIFKIFKRFHCTLK